MQGKYEATAQTGMRGGKATAGPWASASEPGRQATADALAELLTTLIARAVSNRLPP